MGRNNSATWSNIKTICRMRDIDEKELYRKSKMLLETYRKVCWITADKAEYMADGLCDFCGTDIDGALIYLEAFASDHNREKFERKVNYLFETRWMTELIEKAMMIVKEFPRRGDIYFSILSDCYLSRNKYTLDELAEIMELERSTFYDRKKEAVMIFGIALFINVIPEIRGMIKELET